MSSDRRTRPIGASIVEMVTILGGLGQKAQVERESMEVGRRCQAEGC